MPIFTKERVQKALADLDLRTDSGETALITRALLFVEQEVFQTEYPANRARDFIPLDTSVPEWADSFAWRMYDWAGMAKLIANYADDLPMVDSVTAEKIQKVQGLGVGFHYSVQDLRSASKNGVSLDTEKASLARQAHENKIEDLATFGDAAADLPGFLNNANVPLLGSPGDIHGDWLGGATNKEILADMHTIAKSVVSVTKNLHHPDTMILPTDHFAKVSTTQLNDYQDVTILEAFLRQSQWVKNVDQWSALDKGDAARTGPRVVCYERKPQVVRLVLPMDFRMYPPQAKNLAFTVPCESRIGGVSWRRPMAAVYADGV